MLILSIESSCDDTSVALLDCSKKGCFVISEKTASQIDIHKKYGGVVPEIAGRMHAEKIIPLVEEVLDSPLEGGKGGVRKPDVITVTSGPGLITGLLVGVETAKTLSYIWNIPLVAVNHIEGHIHSVEIPNPKSKIRNSGQKTSCELQVKNSKIQYPAIALIASGGHTELIYMKKQGQYKIIGSTLDDAAGECFDKTAKMLNLPYPGGPQISKLAEFGNPQAIKFPRPMLNDKNYNFSFAGLKTSALYWLKNHTDNTLNFHLSPFTLNDFCASFEQAIIDVLAGKTIRAVEKFKPKTIILAGGVSANKKLRETLAQQIKEKSPFTFFLSPFTSYCMDNATMIGVAGYYKAKEKKFTSWKKIKANPNWRLA